MNNLNGSVTGIFDNNRQLSSLRLDHNYFTDKLPFLQHTNLTNLDLSFNSFEDNTSNLRLPPTIMSLKLGHNKLSGGIPPSLALLTSLQSVDLSYNSLGGSLPQEWQQPQCHNPHFDGVSYASPSILFPQLSLFKCDTCQLSGNIVGVFLSLLTLRSLAQVLLPNNFFNGRLADVPWIYGLQPNNKCDQGDVIILNSLSSLAVLNLGNNALEGPLPSTIPPLLLVLNLAENLKITGSIPTSFRQIGVSINLTYTGITGPFYPEFISLDPEFRVIFEESKFTCPTVIGLSAQRYVLPSAYNSFRECTCK